MRDGMGLYRGKRLDNGEWVVGGLISIDLETYSKIEKEKYTHCIVEPNVEFYRGEICEFGFVIPETVGQYTGLTDKNGKKIFEGDIIDTPDRLLKVVWFKGNAQFDLNFIRHAHDKIITNFKGINMRDLCSYEIIGNIHDNPELLKGGADNG